MVGEGVGVGGRGVAVGGRGVGVSVGLGGVAVAVRVDVGGMVVAVAVAEGMGVAVDVAGMGVAVGTTATGSVGERATVGVKVGLGVCVARTNLVGSSCFCEAKNCSQTRPAIPSNSKAMAKSKRPSPAPFLGLLDCINLLLQSSK